MVCGEGITIFAAPAGEREKKVLCSEEREIQKEIRRETRYGLACAGICLRSPENVPVSRDLQEGTCGDEVDMR